MSYGPVVQWIGHQPSKLYGGGSNPSGTANFREHGGMVDAPDLKFVGGTLCRFKSDCSHQGRKPSGLLDTVSLDACPVCSCLPHGNVHGRSLRQSLCRVYRFHSGIIVGCVLSVSSGFVVLVCVRPAVPYVHYVCSGVRCNAGSDRLRQSWRRL